MTCDGSFQLERTWTLVDQCGPDGTTLTETFTQLIQVGDFTAPTIDFAGNFPTEFTTSAFGCTAVFQVPVPTVTDNCSAEVTTEAYVYAFGDLAAAPFGPYGLGAVTEVLPEGDHVLVYVATDGCGNESRLEFAISLADATPPVAMCNETFNLNLDASGTAWFAVEQIDLGSYDACTDVRLEIRRSLASFPSAPGVGGGLDPALSQLFSPWGEGVSVSCEDAGRYVRIEMRAWDDGNQNGVTGDAGDNASTCWLDLLVGNDALPVCVAPGPVTLPYTELTATLPGDITVAYETDPTATALLLADLFGAATATGNCQVQVAELPPIDARGDCGFGIITRRFQASVATAAGVQTVDCSQLVEVLEAHAYDIQFPVDDLLDCAIDAEGPALVSFEMGCDLLAIQRDTVRLPGVGAACYQLEKTIQIINWCEYDGTGGPIQLGRDENNDGIPGDRFWVAVEGDRAFVRSDRETGLLREIEGYATAVGRGYFEYVQRLGIIDSVAPTVEIETESLVFCAAAATPECEGEVTLDFAVADVCSPDQPVAAVALDAFVADTDADGIISSIEFTVEQQLAFTEVDGALRIAGSFPIGQHAVRISATDECGNATARIVVFTVVDCTAPTPICNNALSATLSVDPGTAEVAVSVGAADCLTGPLDDCSGIAGYAIYRTADVIAQGTAFVPDPSDTALALTCADAGPLAIRVYAIDGAGNADYCETSLLVDADVAGLCAGVGAIAGAIVTEFAEPVANVEVSTTGAATASVTTDATGTYLLSNLTAGGDLTVTPFRNDDHANGVSTYDVVMIQKHILGTVLLSSPYQRIAADATNDGQITTLDLIHLRGLILNNYTELPNCTSWRFVAAGYSFVDPGNPWAEAFPEATVVTALSGEAAADFIGIKIGDVNGSARANAQGGATARTFVDELDFRLTDDELRAGETVALPVRATDLAGVQGYQFTLRVDPQAAELIAVEPGAIGLAYFGLHSAQAGYVTTSWNPASGTTAGRADSEILFTLVVRARTTSRVSDVLRLSDRYTPAEAYDRAGKLLRPRLAFQPAAAPLGHVLYQNAPNPFGGSTVIEYDLSRPGPVTILISDVAGRTIGQLQQTGHRGRNRVELTPQLLGGATGVLHYTVATDDWAATKRMIRTR
jgi:hypothetical protein